MVTIKDPNQLRFEAFKTPFEIEMNRNNRWVRLSEIIPWKALVKLYAKGMSDFGSPGIDARIAIGTMIIKVKLGLSDEETTEQIRENPYMQYFLGLAEYQREAIFDPSLLVHIRERMGKEMMEEMNSVLVLKSATEDEQRKKKKKKKDGTKNNGTKIGEDKSLEGEDEITHKGNFILDATVADQYIKYPTDVELLSDSREKSEGIIDTLYANSQLSKKPRTYRRKARKDDRRTKATSADRRKVWTRQEWI